jgi:hypothetical protein
LRLPGLAMPCQLNTDFSRAAWPLAALSMARLLTSGCRWRRRTSIVAGHAFMRQPFWQSQLFACEFLKIRLQSFTSLAVVVESFP